MNQYEAAEKLGVSLAATFNLLNAKKLPGFRMGSTWTIQPDDLERFQGRNPKISDMPIDYKRIPDWLDGVK